MTRRRLLARLRALGARGAALPVLDHRAADEILGYDDDGIPCARQSARCPDCLRPLATEQDHSVIAEGEGHHLCWRAWSGDQCEQPLPPEERRARARDELLSDVYDVLLVHAGKVKADEIEQELRERWGLYRWPR